MFRKSSRFFHDPLLGMYPDAKILREKCLHTAINQQYGTVFGVKYSEIQHGAEEIPVAAKFFGPGFELIGPFLLIFHKIVPAVENELELVIVIKLIAENPHQVDVKFMQMDIAISLMLLNAHRHII